MSLEPKDPGGRLAYGVNWTDWLESEPFPDDTIVSSTWSIPAGIAQVSAGFTTARTSILVSGGQDLIDYDCVNTITTAANQVGIRTITIPVRKR